MPKAGISLNRKTYTRTAAKHIESACFGLNSPILNSQFRNSSWFNRHLCSHSKQQMEKDEILRLSRAIQAFILSSGIERVRPKELMPHLIAEGFFKKDEKFGKPLRDVLNKLDKNNLLDLLPQVRPERQEKAVYWYFEAAEMTTVEASIEKKTKPASKPKAAPKAKTDVKSKADVKPKSEKVIKLKAETKPKAAAKPKSSAEAVPLAEKKAAVKKPIAKDIKAKPVAAKKSPSATKVKAEENPKAPAKPKAVVKTK